MRAKIILYIVKNSQNNIKYVGITSKRLKSRIRDHYYEAERGSQYVIHKALRKYSDLTFEAFMSLSDWETACEWEKKLIQEFKTHVSIGGYNLTFGGDGNKGHIKSPELRKSISDRMKGKPSPMQGKKHSEEARRKMSEAQKNRKSTGCKIRDNHGNVYYSINEAARKNNVPNSTIHKFMKEDRSFPNNLKFYRMEEKK